MSPNYPPCRTSYDLSGGPGDSTCSRTDYPNVSCGQETARWQVAALEGQTKQLRNTYMFAGE